MPNNDTTEFWCLTPLRYLTNTPEDWRILAKRDMRLVLAYAKTIRGFLQKEIPILFE